MSFYLAQCPSPVLGPGQSASKCLKRARPLTKRFTEGRLDVSVLQGVDLQRARGRNTGHRRRLGLGQEHAAAPAGRAGCAHAAGTVQLKGQLMSIALGRTQQGVLRNQHLGFVYQFHHLLPEFSALDNVAMPLWIRRQPQADARPLPRLPCWPSKSVGDRVQHSRPNSRAANASAWPLRARWSPAGLRAGRRTDRQPRPQHRRRRVRPHAAAGARQGHGLCDGHARRVAGRPLRAARVQQTLQTAGGLSWRDFSTALEDGWLKEGYTVTRHEGRTSGGADLALHKAGVTTLVSAKRWKAASLGVEPLRELKSAIEQAEARDGIVVALGDVTPQAEKFARDNNIRVLQAPDLVRLLGARPAGATSRA
jgi:hypothetical protein